MFLTVYQTGHVYRAMRYETPDVKIHVLDDCLGTERFTVSGENPGEVDVQAKLEARALNIMFVKGLDD